MEMPTISLANLKQISGITKAYLWQEPGKYHAYLRHIPWISQKTLRHLNYIKGKSQAYSNRQPLGKFQTNFRQILDMILAYLTHISGVNSRHISEKYQQNLGYILGIFHENLRQMSSISQVFKYVYVKSSLFSITSLFQSCTCFFWIAMNKFELTDCSDVNLMYGSGEIVILRQRMMSAPPG